MKPEEGRVDARNALDLAKAMSFAADAVKAAAEAVEAASRVVKLEAAKIEGFADRKAP